MCGRFTSAGETGWRARWGWRGCRRICIRVARFGGEVENVLVEGPVDGLVMGRRKVGIEVENREADLGAEACEEKRVKLGRRNGRRRRGFGSGGGIVVGGCVVVEVVIGEG